MDKKTGKLIIVLLFSLILTSCKVENFEGNVASIDNIDLSANDYAYNFRIIKSIYTTIYGDQSLKQRTESGKTLEETLNEEVLDIVIKQTIITTEMKENNEKVTEKEIFLYKDQFISDLGGDKAFIKFLKNAKIEENEFEKYIKDRILEEKYKKIIFKDIEIKDEDIKSLYDENKNQLYRYKISYLVSNNNKDLEKALEGINNGLTFKDIGEKEKLNILYADGDKIGYYSKGDLSEKLEKEITRLSIGEVSEVIESDEFYYVFKLEDYQDSYDELKPSLERMLKEDKYFTYLDNLLDDMVIEINKDKLKEVQKNI